MGPHFLRPPRLESSPSRPPLRSVRLLDQLRERIPYDHYSLKTEKLRPLGEAVRAFSRAATSEGDGRYRRLRRSMRFAVNSRAPRICIEP